MFKQVDSTIHWIAQLAPLIFVHRIVIYLVDIAIQLLNNWGQECGIVKFKNLKVKLRVLKPDNTRQGKAKQDKTRQDWHDTMALKSLT